MHYYFGDGPHCAFANIANLLHYFGDTEGADYFVENLTTPPDDLLPAATVSRIPESKRYQRLPTALHCLRLLKYTVTKLKNQENIKQYNPSQANNCGCIFQPKFKNTDYFHVVAIADGKLIDGSCPNLMLFVDENLDWCCGAKDEFLGFCNAWEIIIPNNKVLEKKMPK